MNSKSTLTELFQDIGAMPPGAMLDTAGQMDRDENALDELRDRVDAALLNAADFRRDSGDILLDGVDDIRLMVTIAENLTRENDSRNDPVIYGLHRKIGLSLHQSLIKYATSLGGPSIAEAFPSVDDAAQGLMGLGIKGDAL